MNVVAPGIYRLPNGTFRAVARVGDRKTGPRPQEKRFPKNTPLREMKAWQEGKRSEMRRSDLRPATGTYAADRLKYLDCTEGQLEYPTCREYETAAWLPTFGHRNRHTITDREIEDQVRTWQREGVAASTIRHRLSALSMLYKVLDGKNAYNPVSTVKRPVEPKPGINAVPLEMVVKVSKALAERVAQNNRGWKTLARIRVLAETGMRHSQVMRLTPMDLRLEDEQPVVLVNQAGKGGKPHWKPLTASGVAACKLFIEHDAFGKFSQSSIYKSWKLACEDANVPFFNPYRLRHTYATTLRAEGMDLADVQELVGHTNPRTTARYAMVAPAKLVGARGALDRAWTRARKNVQKEGVGTSTASVTKETDAIRISRTGG